MERASNYRFILAFFALFFALSVSASPLGTTYQAHIIKPNGQALEASNVNFKFSILNPLGSCVVYSETFSAINMNDSAGIISFTLGSGVKTYPVSAVTFADVFNNSTASLSCDTGGPVSYSPAATDVRKIVMQFNDGVGWQTLPAMSINAVPYSIFSNDSLKLGGVSATSFVQYSTIPTCSASSQALQYNGTSFSCVTIAGGGGASGTITSSDVTTALGYTPANQTTVGTSFTSVANSLSTVGTSFSTVTSTINSLGSSVTAISTSVNTHTSSITALTSTVNAHTASLAAITSSQWLTSGTKISYNSGNVGIGTSNPVTRLEIANGNATLTNNFDGFSISAYNIDWSYPVSATIGLGRTPWNQSWGETMEFRYTSPDPFSLPPTYVFKGSTSGSDVYLEDGRIRSKWAYLSDHLFIQRADTNNASQYILMPNTNFTSYDFFQAFPGTGASFSIGAVSSTGQVRGYSVGVSSGTFQIKTANQNRMTFTNAGLIGVGTSSPVTTFDVSGGVRVGYEGASCAIALAGTLRYTSGNVEYCNGTTWQAFGTGGAVTSSSVISALGYTPANSATVGASITANANALSALSTSYTTINNSLTTVATSVTALTSSFTSLAASVTALGSGGSSQWTTRGQDVTYTNGNVGVGTTSPTVKFSVGDSLTIPEAQLGDVASATIAEFNGIQSITTGAKSMVTINSVASTSVQATGIDSGLAVHMRISPNQDPGVPLGMRIGIMNINENTTSATAQNLYGNFNMVANTGGGVTNGLIGNASVIENMQDSRTTIGIIDMNQMINYASMTQVMGTYGVMQNQGDITMLHGIDYTMWNQGHTSDFQGYSLHMQNFVSATKIYGVMSDVTNSNGAEAQEIYGIISRISNYMGASTTTAYGLYLDKMIDEPITNNYGIFQNDSSKNYFAGRIGIGTSSPVTALEVSGGIRVGTETATCAVSYAGTVRYMASTLQLCNGSSWNPVANFASVPNISNAGNITLTPNVAGSVIISATTTSSDSGTGALVVNGGVGVAGALNVNGNILSSGTVISSTDLIPASSTLLMSSCPGGWTDLGAAGSGGPGAVWCNGAVCRMCNTTVAAPIPAGSQVLMESCPSGWTNLGRAIGAGSAAYIVGSYAIPMVTCQSPGANSVLPKGLRFMMPSCPASWNDIATTPTGPNLANCPTASCHVCETSQGTTYQRVLFGGDSSGTTTYGSDAYIMGGRGGSTSGGGGTVYVRAGSAVDGAGGSVQITGGSASSTTGTGYSGGAVSIVGGFTPMTSGTGGVVNINGGSNGSGLYADVFLNGNGGAVYVGNTSSGYQGKLEIRSATNIGSLVPTNISSFASGGLRILNNMAGSVTEAISFGSVPGVSAAGAAIAFRRQTTQTAIDFYTNSGSDLADGAIRNVATLSYNGYLGLGTSTPSTVLHAVNSTATNGIAVGTFETTSSNARPYLNFKGEGNDLGFIGFADSGADNLYFWNKRSANLYFGTSGTTAIAVNPSYKVLIGDVNDVPTPLEKLHVDGDISLGTKNLSTRAINLFQTAAGGGNAYGIYFDGLSPGNYKTILRTNGIPVLTAMQSGRVGIGTSAPAYVLDVAGSGNFTTTTGGVELSIGNSTMTSANKRLRIIQDANANFTRLSNNIDSITYMAFQMDTGNVGIGTTNPGYTLDVNGSARATGSVAAWSDIRAKKNIKVIPDSLAKILQLRGVTFDWRNDEFPDKKFKTTRDIGVIAQEVEKVFPEAVQTAPDSYKSVAYSQLVAPLIEAVKELYYKITGVERKVDRMVANVEQKADKAEVEKLKAENAELKQRLDRLEKMMLQNQKKK